jgi:molybdate transport system substrate-binding protein
LIHRVLLGALVLVWGCSGGTCESSRRGQRTDRVTVSAAVSLNEVMATLSAEHRRRTGVEVVVNTGPSNVLARQIIEGAPIDLFVSADESQMDHVAAAGLVIGDSRVSLASNQLVVVVPREKAGSLTSISGLSSPSIRRIALGNPAAVPAGVYAKAYLQRSGLWNEVADRIVETTSVRAALGAVDASEADAAIVYRTDVATARSAVVAMEVPVDEAPRIVYPAAQMLNGPNPAAARAFLDYIQSDDAWPFFERAGFLRPPS